MSRSINKCPHLRLLGGSEKWCKKKWHTRFRMRNKITIRKAITNLNTDIVFPVVKEVSNRYWMKKDDAYLYTTESEIRKEVNASLKTLLNNIDGYYRKLWDYRSYLKVNVEKLLYELDYNFIKYVRNYRIFFKINDEKLFNISNEILNIYIKNKLNYWKRKK